MMNHNAHGSPARHVPVLRDEAVARLAPRAGGVYVDATFGAGGYARAILATPGTTVFAIDRDPDAIAAGQALVERHAGRLKLLQGRFSQMEELLAAHGVEQVDGVVFDLGVSSMQLDEGERGFSFMRPGPLDMRMEQAGMTAAEVVNEASEEQLAEILWLYGEERRSRAIARAIVRRRGEQPITTTGQLAALVEQVLGPKRKPGQAHPATRTFQALRIYVNGELEEAALGLAAAERLLKPGGVLAVVSFHSLEDRLVKRFINLRAGRGGRPSRHLPQGEEREPSLSIMDRGGVKPSPEEIEANPRARSARLRAARRRQAPAWPLDMEALGLPRPGRGGSKGGIKGGRGR